MEHIIPLPNTITNPSYSTALSRKIEIMKERFPGRTDTFGLYAGGPSVRPLRAKSPISEKDYYLHIKGDKFHRIGIYPIVDGCVKWAMTDVDELDRATNIVDWAKARAAVNTIVFYLKENGLHPHVEISKSKGYHIWIFFNEPILAGVVRSILKNIIKKAGEKDREIFPKQAETRDGFGNFAALPLHGGSVNEGFTVFLNPDFTPITDQWKYLESASRTKIEDMEELYRSIGEESKAREIPPSSGPMFDVAKYLLERGVQFTIKQDLTKTLYPLPKCFWADQHTTADGHGDSAVIQDTTGLITYHCFHAHCQGRTWRDVRNVLEQEPGAEARTLKDKTPNDSKFERNGYNLIQGKCDQVIPNLEFPRDAIGGVAREFADRYTANFESPWSFWAFNFLTCLGSLISDKITLASGINPQPRLFLTNLGRSADDRKSEGIKKTVSFFEDTFIRGEFKVCHGVGSAEGLARKFNDMPEGPRKLLLVYDEAKSFVSKATIQGSTLAPAINTFFESNRFHSATKQHLIEIENAYLSFLAASTLETFTRMWTPDFLDIGFTNRLWLVYDHAERRFSIPKEIPEWDLKPIRKKLSEIISGIPSGGLRLSIDEDARKIFDDWYFGEGSISSPLAKRLDTYGLRLMILLSVNEGYSSVNAEIVKKVINLLRWQLQVRRLCDPIDAESKTAKVEEMIRRSLSGRGTRTQRDLKRDVNYQRYGLNIWQFAIDNLTKAGEILFDPKDKTYYQKAEER
jgi:hypothetical protein